MQLFYSYLGPDILRGFDSYKYSSKDTSPLSNYVMHPFWNQVGASVKVLINDNYMNISQVVKLCPIWVAPNLLTFVGFICCFGHFGLLAPVRA